MKAVAAFLAVVAMVASTELPAEDPGKVFWLRIDSTINPGTVDFIDRAVEKSLAANAQCLVIEMDTPGGLLDSTRSIVKTLLNSELPVVVYVSPRGARAGSAGVFITLAAHVAVMAPGTNIGAAHPVSGMGKDPEAEGGKHLAQKIENDTTAFIETIAQQRSRNVEWAKEAVLKSVSVTETKALALKVIDFVAEDRQDLLRRLDGRSVNLPKGTVTLRTKDAVSENLDMSLKQRFVDFFSNPNVAFFLGLIAVLGIYLELSHPGAILPGFAAALSIILLLLSAQSLPFNLAGILLLLVGAVFFVLEVYVTSYGMLSVGGILCFIAGSLLLFDVQPVTGFWGISRPAIYTSAFFLALAVFGVAALVAKSQRTRVVTGYEGMIGETGNVVEALRPEGKISIAGEYWNARAGTEIAVGTKVRVTAADGLWLVVEKKEKS